MRCLLKWTAGGAALLLLAAAAAAALFLEHPGVFVTDWAAAAAVKRFGRAYGPSWETLSVTADRYAPRRHRYSLRATKLCAREPAGRVSGCLSELELAVTVSFSRRGARVERLERLAATGDRVRVDLRPRPAAPPAAAAPLALRSVEIGDVRLSLTRLTAVTARGELKGAVKAAWTPSDRRPLTASLDLASRAGALKTRVKADLAADPGFLQGAATSYLDATGEAELGGLGRARLKARVHRAGKGWAGAGQADVSPSTGPLRAVSLARCLGNAGPAGAELACRYDARLAKAFAGVASVGGGIRVRAKIDAKAFDASLSMDADPVVAWYRIAGGLEARASGRLGRPMSEWKASHDLRAAIDVPKFEDLVARLRDSPYAVPAPLHVLKGPLSLELRSRGDPRDESPRVEYDAASRLAGVRQRLTARARGTLTVLRARTPGRAFVNDGALTLEEVALELPRLEVGESPKVFVDKRIQNGDDPPLTAAPASAARGPAVASRLTVKTVKPLVLFSNLAKQPVPVALDLDVGYSPVAVGGTIGVRSFDIELFRRTATIDHVNVVLSSGSTVGTIEGLVRYETEDVKISILILGTTERPRIELTSVPPMKRADIIALLIFGKSPDELDPEQTASVSNTETALESRAFGLASLYLFGATPIEHVGYDPGTKTTSVRLRLPGGANLTLGSDFDQSRQLTVRKPLARHWAIQSEMTSQSAQGQQSSSAATFLEWFNRY